MKNAIIVAVAALALVPASFAADVNFDSASRGANIKEYVSSAIKAQEAALPQPAFADVAAPRAAAVKFNPNTRVGRVSGSFAGRPVSLSFSRMAWSMDGFVRDSQVSLKLDMSAMTMNGVANGAPVALNFDWNDSISSTRGQVAGSSMDLTADWQRGALEGYFGAASVRLDFNMDGGTITGYAGRDAVSLNYNRFSGKLAGTIGNDAIDVNAVNMNDADIINFLFLFFKP